MNITFLIGNGFDINCGVKTKYTDMYPDYIATASESRVLARFKAALQRDGRNQYKTWGDFEMGMAAYSKEFFNEGEFVACIRDFKEFMTNYLIRQQEEFQAKISNDDALQSQLFSEVEQSLFNFYKNGVTNNTIYAIDEIVKASNVINYNFISFNYTTEIANYLIRKTLSRYLSTRVRGQEIINIHGTLGNDVVLGVDNEAQLNHIQFDLSKRGKRAFLKPFFNDEFDKRRAEEAERIIKSSNIICVYGMSLGDSDLTWRKMIKEWLQGNPAHHLFYFCYSASKISQRSFDELMDREEDEKIKLLVRFGIENGLDNPISDQIHIPIGANIFNVQETISNYNKGRSKTFLGVAP